MDLNVLLHGLVAGCLYALAGISLNVLYRPTNTFNFAQGDLIMVGAMVCAALIGVSKLPWYVAAALSLHTSRELAEVDITAVQKELDHQGVRHW